MKKKNRNLLYALPIAEVDEMKMKGRIEYVIGHSIEKIDLNVAAEYKGVLDSIRDLSELRGYIMNGEEIHAGAWAAYATDSPVAVSFAFKHAHGVQHFDVLEKGKRNKPDITYDFAVTDVEFGEDYFVLFGIAKDKVTKSDKEYLLYFFIDTMSFIRSDIQIRKLKDEVFVNYSEIEARRLSTMMMYAYKYLKKADEVRLRKITEFLTGTSILKPGKNMFELLFLEKDKDDNSTNRELCIDNALKSAFHRYVQTSLGNANVSLVVHDGHEEFQMPIEEIRPCEDKNGLRCRGLRVHEATPWDNYWLNVEYDLKKDQLYVYDKNWERVTSTLTFTENEEGIKSKRIIRRCVSTYIKAKSSCTVCR